MGINKSSLQNQAWVTFESLWSWPRKEMLLWAFPFGLFGLEPTQRILLKITKGQGLCPTFIYISPRNELEFRWGKLKCLPVQSRPRSWRDAKRISSTDLSLHSPVLSKIVTHWLLESVTMIRPFPVDATPCGFVNSPRFRPLRPIFRIKSSSSVLLRRELEPGPWIDPTKAFTQFRPYWDLNFQQKYPYRYIHY